MLTNTVTSKPTNIVAQIQELRCLIDNLIKKINTSCPDCVGKLSISIKGNMLRLKHSGVTISSTPLLVNNPNIQFRVNEEVLQYNIDG